MTDTTVMEAAELRAPLNRPRLRASLGAILVREGHITVERLEVGYIDLAGEEIDPEAAKLLPGEFARRY